MPLKTVRSLRACVERTRISSEPGAPSLLNISRKLAQHIHMFRSPNTNSFYPPLFRHGLFAFGLRYHMREHAIQLRTGGFDRRIAMRHK